MIGVIIVFLLIPVVALVLNAIDDYNRSISFSNVYEEAGLPIVTLENGDSKYNFLVDTGANLCVLNAKYAETMQCEPVGGTGTMFGMEGNIQEVTYVKAELTHGKDKFNVSFQVIDIDNAFGRIEQDYNITVHGVLGTAFLERYKGKVDFIEHKLKYGKEDKAKVKGKNK